MPQPSGVSQQAQVKQTQFQNGAAARSPSGAPPSPQDTSTATAATVSTTASKTDAQSAIEQKAQIQQPTQQNATSAASSSTDAAVLPDAFISFTPNILDSCANYTYHIRWSMVTEGDASSLTKQASAASSIFRNNVGKIIIAESGVTGLYNITDLELDTILPGAPQTPQTNELTATMTVVEPYGITLMDNLFGAAQSIGIKNYLQAGIYFIEIWFTGYNEDGTINTGLNNIYKVWQVDFQDFDSHTTEAGTTYKFKFLIHNLYGTADHVAVLTDNTEITASTVGSFFAQLAKAMTTHNANSYDSKKPKISYKFNTDFAANWKFDKKPVNSQRQASTTGNLTNPTITVAKGMDVNSILNFVTSMSTDAQNWAAGEGNSNSSGTQGQAALKANGLANLIALHTWTDLDNDFFDPKLNDYGRVVTYTFVRYPTARAIIDLDNAARTRTPGVQEQRQLALATSKNFVKHYFWTYTGKNLDVTKFDLHLTIKDQLGIVENLGTRTYGNFTVGAQFNAQGVANAQTNQFNNSNQTSVAATISTAPAAVSSNNPDGAAAPKPVVTQTLGNTNPQQNDQVATSQLASVTKTNASTGEQATLVAEAKAMAAKTTENVAAAAKSVTSANTPLYLQRKASYIEDVGTSLFSPNPFPISGRAAGDSYIQDTVMGNDGPQQNNSKSSNADNTPPSRGVLASILNESRSQPMVRMDLEIRGDPYWLGFSNLDELVYINKGTVPDPTIRTAAAWWFGGDVGYVFSLQTGTSYDESTGFMNFNDKTVMWNGYWKVLRVKSIFKNGTFSQTLHSNRDILSDPPTNPPTNSAQAASAATNTVASSLQGFANTVQSTYAQIIPKT
jgi:hypothetical protein